MTKPADSSCNKETPDSTWTSQVTEDAVYKHLTDYYLYQDRLSWSRTQTLVVLEAALLAASYAKAGTFIAPVILILGTFVVWLIWRLIKRDWQVRDQNLKLLDQVHERKGIRMVVPASTIWSKGSFITPRVVDLIIGVNVVLTVCYVLLISGRQAEHLQRLFGLK